MKINNLILISAFVSVGSSSLMGLSANITYGSTPAVGGALFQGEDGLSADSIAIGFFTAAANAELTGWTAIQTDTTFNTTGGFNSASIDSADVTSANGLDAWILILDGSLTGLIRANDWAAYSGIAAPGSPSTLTYELDLSDSLSTVSFLQSSSTLVNITNSGGQGGSGIGVQLTAVPEPSSYAAFAGLLALAAVINRRRRV
jgi:hypothetical protein